jgi:hypothetical protein
LSFSSSIFIAGAEVYAAVWSLGDVSYPSVAIVDDFLLINNLGWIVGIYLDFQNSFSSEHPYKEMVFSLWKHGSLIDHE